MFGQCLIDSQIFLQSNNSKSIMIAGDNTFQLRSWVHVAQSIALCLYILGRRVPATGNIAKVDASG